MLLYYFFFRIGYIILHEPKLIKSISKFIIGALTVLIPIFLWNNYAYNNPIMHLENIQEIDINEEISTKNKTVLAIWKYIYAPLNNK